MSSDPVDSIDTNWRYLAYFSRFKTLLTTGSRYLAYSSDIGEAFRPIVKPWMVRMCYFVSWGYVGGDVGYLAYRTQQQGLSRQEQSRVCLERFVFQALASMAIPAFTIHTLVTFASKQCRARGVANRWIPTLIGFSVVPFLPMIDHPVEQAVETTFEKISGPTPLRLQHNHDSANHDSANHNPRQDSSPIFNDCIKPSIFNHNKVV